tara:strand:+ start:178 stop:462 length:285 start_codon:yes stop_codon:yes gene_type:complete
MSKITLKEDKNEIYFMTTTEYLFDIDGKEQKIRIEEDSNEGRIHYFNGFDWTEEPPDWIKALGENEWGGLNFESWVWENVSGWEAGETIDTELE